MPSCELLHREMCALVLVNSGSGESSVKNPASVTMVECAIT